MNRHLFLAAALLCAAPAAADPTISAAQAVAMFGVADIECPGGVGGPQALELVLRRAARSSGVAVWRLSEEVLDEIPWARDLWLQGTATDHRRLCSAARRLSRP